jgi:hypothetical protein
MMPDTWKYHLSGNAHKKRRNKKLKKYNVPKNNVFTSFPDTAKVLAEFVYVSRGLELAPRDVNSILISNGIIKKNDKGFVNTTKSKEYSRTCTYGKDRLVYVRYKRTFRNQFLGMVDEKYPRHS